MSKTRLLGAFALSSLVLAASEIGCVQTDSSKTSEDPDVAGASGASSSSAGASGDSGGSAAGGTSPEVSVDCPGAVPAGIAASWCSCAQWGELTEGDVTYYNDIWGSGAGPQCIWVAGEKWGIASNHPSGGSVKAYPNISFSPGTPVGDINTYTSSFEVTLPDGGAWEATYDIWVKNSSGQRIEIMLWMMTHGSVFPASSTADPAAPNVDVGGHTWNVYYGAFGGNEVDTLIRTSGTASATVDVKAILDWLIANKQSFDDNWTLDQVQFGFEIVSDEAVHSYVVDSFSVSSS